MNSVMANAVWMLSENSAEEIDIVEAYGSSFSESAGAAKTWFAQRMHLSHHRITSYNVCYTKLLRKTLKSTAKAVIQVVVDVTGSIRSWVPEIFRRLPLMFGA